VSGPNVEQAEVAALRDYLTWLAGYAAIPGDSAFDRRLKMARQTVDRVAALVAAAEERGFDRGVREAGSGPALAAVRAEAEWRGAEKERERTKRLASALNVALAWHDGRASGTDEERAAELAGCQIALADYEAAS
jgi:hypothetical protein